LVSIYSEFKDLDGIIYLKAVQARMAKIFNDFHFQIFVQMFVFNSWPKKQHSLYKKSAGKLFGIVWDLFHLTRPLAFITYKSICSIFSYGYQSWAITFSRHEKTLGVYLVWRNPSDGVKVILDFAITLLNRDHFSLNQSYTAKTIKFTSDAKSNIYSVYSVCCTLYYRG
jgi:hypothetical protein